MQNTLKQITIYSLSMFLALLLFFGIVIVYAWTEPASAPPAGNVSAPVNVGGTSQYKSGALGVGGVFHGYSTGLFDGSVGIGTTGPARLLHLSSAGPQIGFSETGVTANNTLWDMLVDQEHFAARILDDADTVATTWLQVERTGQTVDSVTIPNGNVGIGTTPSQKLDVNGIIAVEGQAALDQNGTNILVGDLAGGDGVRGLILRSGDRDRAMISGAETIFYDSNGNQVLILDQGN